MKKWILLFLLAPLTLVGQDAPDLIFEVVELRVAPDKVVAFEQALATHNKKFHASGDHGVRVYWVSTGAHSGEYRWVMGPAPWSSLDNRPQDDAHDSDWNKVTANMMPGGRADYIRYDPTVSRFPNDFNISKLLVTFVDIERGKWKEVKDIVEKVHKVYTEKIPGETYGIYWNQLASGDGEGAYDLTIVSFFDKYAWMGEEHELDKHMEATYGREETDKIWEIWRTATLSIRDEIWVFRDDLSGIGGMIKAADRQ